MNFEWVNCMVSELYLSRAVNSYLALSAANQNKYYQYYFQCVAMFRKQKNIGKSF